MKNIFFIPLLAIAFILGCGKNATTPTPPPVPPVPSTTTKAVLILPAQNELCTTGALISSDLSVVTFKWNASALAENYTLVLKNLRTSEIITKIITNTETQITIEQSTPYSWLIRTKSSINTSSIESDTWKFYNSGFATASYAPYPSELTSPAMSQKLSASSGKVNLLWYGSDVDNDIVNYDVFFGTSSSPALVQAAIVSPFYSATIVSGTTYYWKIVTRDSRGNTSDSAIYQFTTL